MPNTWFHPPVANYDEQGRRVSEQNFVVEARSELAILIRELLQNALDARIPGRSSPVEVTIRLAEGPDLNIPYANSLIDEDMLDRLIASSEHSVEIDTLNPTALVVEDFGTTGLLGTHSDSTVDGSGENWNSFWFREGEGAKGDNSSNGGAGQGKITFYSQSAARALLALTVRSNDSAQLLMGRASFRRDYRRLANERKFKKTGYWCQRDANNTPLPDSSHEGLLAFKSAFGIKRGVESGLSLVIPYPRTYKKVDALKIVLGEFFFPIARGRLRVVVDGEQVTASTVSDLARQHLSDKEVRDVLELCLTDGYRAFLREVIEAEVSNRPAVVASDDWASESAQLKADHFPAGAVDEMRASLHGGERVHVRFPFKVKRIGGVSCRAYLDVHIQLPLTELDVVEETYIRNDLLIGKERKLKNLRHLPKVRALTFVSDEALSKLMADAEEASHLEWNGKKEKLTENWANGPEIVRRVRNALPRLLTLLASVEGARDVKALARFFTKPAPAGTPRGAGQKPGGRSDQSPPEPPAPQPAVFSVKATDSAISVTSTGHGNIVGGIGTLRVAFDELDGNPFKSYDPFDFDLANADQHPVETQGCRVLTRRLNELKYEINSKEMSLVIRGFEAKNVPLVARMTFTEVEHAANDEAE